MFRRNSPSTVQEESKKEGSDTEEEVMELLSMSSFTTMKTQDQETKQPKEMMDI